MFKYQITARIADRARPVTVALTHFSDMAEFIRTNAAEALDPGGKMGLSVEIVTREEADMFVHHPRGNDRA